MRITYTFLLILFFAQTQIVSGTTQELVEWLPARYDYVGARDTAGRPQPNGINDWHIRLTSDTLAGRSPAAWRIQGGRWFTQGERGYWHRPHQSGWKWDTHIMTMASGRTVDFYFEPLLAWPGDVFEITAVFGQDDTLSWQVVCNDNYWRDGATWKGQGGHDRLGPRDAKPDGVREWEIHIEDPFIHSVARVDVFLPYLRMGGRIAGGQIFNAWSTTDRIQSADTGYLQYDQYSDALTVRINPVLASGGDTFIVRVVREDGTWALWKTIGLGDEWQAGGTWFGQSNEDRVSAFDATKGNGVNDWHFRVASPELSSPIRWMVRGAGHVWEWTTDGYTPYDPAHRAMAVSLSGGTADIYIDPVMERAGDTFYVTAVLSDGTMLNWGVISTHEMRSLDVAWHGQDTTALMPSSLVDGAMVAPWRIAVRETTLTDTEAWLWRVRGGGHTWEYARDAEEIEENARTLRVEQEEDAVQLFLDPVWARPGTEFNVEAFLADGRVIQWTAVADGAEWAGAAEWDTMSGADYVGHQAMSGPDDHPDWKLILRDDMLNDEPTQVSLHGLGWRWQWPHNEHTAPAHVIYMGTAMNVYIAPVPGSPAKAGDSVTCIALMPDGTLRVWKAVHPGPR